MTPQSLSARLTAGLVLVATALPMTGIGAQAAPASSGITFATPLSTVRGSLPLFRLHRIAAPTSFVRNVLGKSHPLGVENSMLVARDANKVAQAYLDGRSGDAQIFPDLTARSAGQAGGGSPLNVANAVFNRYDVIPKDATKVRLGDATPVFSTQAHLSNGKTLPKSAPQKLFTYVSLARFAAGLPVVGDGSQATVAVAGDGSIRGFVRRWQAATPAGTVASTTSAAQLTQAIDAQLRPFENANTSITVESVKPVYFDGNANFLQPVYLFLARLHARSGGTSDDHVRGYVPVGKLVERLPLIGQHNGSSPSAPRHTTQSDVSQISLGEYANRDGSMQDMANAYLNGFDSVPAWWFGPPIVRTQWYWAYPYEVTSSSQYYLNAVNVAYTMPHGDWYENTTYSNYADFWYVNQIGTGGNKGYGAATGGQLATWIIDSCEVAPSYYDLQVTTGNGNNAFNYWWPVFQGLHRVLAFRTQMLLGEDTMNYNIAQSMAYGANANSAFFNGVAAGYFPWTYLDTHLNQNVHYDRASLFYDPRNANESIYAVQGQGASGQLSNVWMGN